MCGEVRSRSGVLIRVNKVPVYWRSSLQKVTSTKFDPELDPDTSVGQKEIATSSAYGETLAGADAATAALHIGYVADELGAPFPKPNIIHIDATAAKSFFENTGGASKMKHIDIRSEWVQMVRDRHHSSLRRWTEQETQPTYSPSCLIGRNSRSIIKSSCTRMLIN